MTPAPISVGIPTYARGDKVETVIERVLACQPPPAEVIVHVDQSNGELEKALAVRFPALRLLSSVKRVGPGGGRHRCLMAASEPIFASFDDDSVPIDPDYFARLVEHFSKNPSAACLAAVIFHRGDSTPELGNSVKEVPDYIGCGYAMRVEMYRTVPGHFDRTVPYGFEERDVTLQLNDAGWHVLLCEDLRVFHDTILSHHGRPEITSGTIENAVLLAWLRYPVSFWFYGMLQVGNLLFSLLKQGRFAGVTTGLLRSPVVVWNHRRLRKPVSARTLQANIQLRHDSLKN